MASRQMAWAKARESGTVAAPGETHMLTPVPGVPFCEAAPGGTPHDGLVWIVRLGSECYVDCQGCLEWMHA